MRTPEEIWKSLVIPSNQTIAVVTIPDIAAIQKEAYEAGQDKMLQKVRELRADWLKENGPGGWIDNMRQELKKYQTHTNTQ